MTRGNEKYPFVESLLCSKWEIIELPTPSWTWRNSLSTARVGYFINESTESIKVKSSRRFLLPFFTIEQWPLPDLFSQFLFLLAYLFGFRRVKQRPVMNEELEICKCFPVCRSNEQFTTLPTEGVCTVYVLRSSTHLSKMSLLAFRLLPILSLNSIENSKFLAQTIRPYSSWDLKQVFLIQRILLWFPG